MSPRRNSPRRDSSPRNARRASRRRNDTARAVPTAGSERQESGPDGEWIVRRISGAGAVKYYRCPGCAQEIPPGMAHVVSWPVNSGTGDRRHWHSSCWEMRGRRGVRYPRG